MSMMDPSARKLLAAIDEFVAEHKHDVEAGTLRRVTMPLEEAAAEIEHFYKLNPVGEVSPGQLAAAESEAQTRKGATKRLTMDDLQEAAMRAAHSVAHGSGLLDKNRR